MARTHATATAQRPFAVILGCIDSRVPPELVFDQGIGDVFTIRVAGNVLNDDVLGSMEFACAVAKSKLIVVLGHSGCGAVAGACSGVELEHLTGLLDKIRPQMAGETVTAQPSADLIQRTAERHADQVSQEICRRSETLARLVERAEVGVVCGMYAVETGAVEFGPLMVGRSVGSC